MITKIYDSFWLAIDEQMNKIIDKHGYVTPDHLQEEVHIQYGKDEEQYFDMYYPKDKKDEKLPVIIHMHGGAFISGVQAQYSEYCRLLADQGYCVINLEFIRGMRRGFPHPVFDFYKFYEFIQNNPEISKHIDYDNLLLSGDSSGAAITSLITNIQVNPKVREAFGLEGGPNVKGCIFTSPMLGYYEFNGLWPKEVLHKHIFKEYYKTPIQDVTHLLKNLNDKFPPCVVISAKNDPIKLHAYMFEKKAKEMGLSLEHYCMTTGKHLLHCSNMTYPYDHESKIAMTKIYDFVKKTLTNTNEKEVIYDTINKKTELDREFMTPKSIIDEQLLLKHIAENSILTDMTNDCENEDCLL